MKLAGVDLAWQGEHNPSAIVEQLTKQADLQGIAIDAPLIINNETGQRQGHQGQEGLSNG